MSRSTYLPAAALLALAGCATTGATFGSGVGDRMLARPPYVAGQDAAAIPGAYARIGHLPVVFQRGASQAPIFDPRDTPDTPIGALLADVNAALDSLARDAKLVGRLVEGGRVSAVTHGATRVPPDVMFGCLTPGNLPGEECIERGRDSVLGRGPQQMRLAVGRPSAEWTQWIGEVARERNADAVLVLTLEVGQYLPVQSGVRGSKRVPLGRDHEVSLPWLTSLETPVPVLQLTGALVRPDGKVVRIAAEGIAARRTPLAISALRGQSLFGDEDVRAAHARRREELPGQPLAWEVALRTVVAELTGQAMVAQR